MSMIERTDQSLREFPGISQVWLGHFRRAPFVSHTVLDLGARSTDHGCYLRLQGIATTYRVSSMRAMSELSRKRSKTIACPSGVMSNARADMIGV